jgi:phage terminase large subunit
VAAAATLENAGRLKISSFYEPFPKQRRFHASPAKYRLFGGAAGPGKSKAILMEAIYQANRWPKVETLLLRRTFPELEKSLLREFRMHVPREAYASYNDQKHIVHWHNGSTTTFGYCMSDDDAYNYLGGEYLYIGIDELTLFSLRQFEILKTRLRCPIPGTFPCFAGATNPGSRGHAWVKALWIDKEPPAEMEQRHEYRPSDYDFTPALLNDNPLYHESTLAGQLYRATLMELPTALRNAYLNGDWNIFAGQYFDNWNAAIHTADSKLPDAVDDRGNLLVPKMELWHPRWISVDYGFEHNTAVHWHCQTGPKVVTYRELVANHMTPRTLGFRIAELSGTRDAAGFPVMETIKAAYGDPYCFAKRSDVHTMADQISDVLHDRGLPRLWQADNDRKGGWMLMYQMLEQRRWVILKDKCPNLCKVLPSLVRDTEDDPDDILKVDGDDAPDSARYGLKSFLQPRGKPLEQRIQERVTSKDPTTAMMQLERAQREEANKSIGIHYGRRGRWPRRS